MLENVDPQRLVGAAYEESQRTEKQNKLFYIDSLISLTGLPCGTA